MQKAYPRSSLFKCQPVQKAKNELDTLRIEWKNNKSQFNKYKELAKVWEKYNQLCKEFVEVK